ncbi:VWA domain-containing protein [bacterium]|nr:MAG: VWA domain-containing protein [bacterium]
MVLVIDTSSSMEGGSLEEVKKASKAYVNRQDTTRTRIAVVDFGSNVRTDSPLTRDKAALSTALDSLQVDGLTRMDLGLQEAGGVLRNRAVNSIAGNVGGEKANVLLFTDGAPSGTGFLGLGGETEAKNAADALKGEGVKLVAIGSIGADTDFLEKLTGSPQLVFQTSQGTFDEAFVRAEVVLRETGTTQLISSGVQKNVDDGRALWRLSGWNAILGGMLALALVLAQARLTRARLGKMDAVAVVTGIALGALAGATGQGTFAILASEGKAALALGRLLGWSLLGVSAGAALAWSLPNVRRFPILLGGASGGIIGAVAFTIGARLGGDVAGRWAGAMAIGAGVGLMIALAEVAARSAWISVSFGPVDSYDLALGESPVAVGSDRSCRAFVPAIEPVAARYGFQSGAAFISWPDGRHEPLGDGDSRAFGKANITLHLERGTSSPAVNAPLPFPVPGMPITEPGLAPTAITDLPGFQPPLPPTPPPPPAAPKPLPSLRWKWADGDSPVSIESGKYSLGRASDNNIVFAESSVSSHHARLELRGGRWILTDLGSTNGTFIGETRLQAYIPTPIPIGQDVRLGSLSCRFERS